MDEEIERLVVTVRADTGAFARDVTAMKAELDGPFGEGVARAGQALESALLRAVRTGKSGFEDLKRTILAVMSDIAAAAIRSGFGGSGGGGGGMGDVLTSLLMNLLGSPGRATGGPVTGGQSQKEVFHNEALTALDLLVDAAVENMPSGTPRSVPRSISAGSWRQARLVPGRGKPIGSPAGRPAAGDS